MKKGLKVTGLVVGVVSLIGLGGVFGASASGLSFQDNVVNNAYSDLLDTASSTVNKLTGNVDSDIQNKTQEQIQSSVDQQQKELEQLLDEYYQMKLDNATDTKQFKDLEERIKQVKESVAEAYKQRIDEAFEGK